MFDLKSFLDSKVQEYNRPDFVPNDPICIPHQFVQRENIEIMGFIAAVLAWGQRKTIINKCNELIARMDGDPFDFIAHHEAPDLRALLGFKHRTFNDTDLLYFVSFFRQHYQRYSSLEDAFLLGQEGSERVDMAVALDNFKAYFFSLPDYPVRTRKHVSSPQQNSTCKRLNMFLRWMVRRDDAGVDFGVWQRIHPRDLIAPCDVHVERVARKFHLITRDKVDWKTAVELTENLRRLDPEDPVKYDFALFGLGVEGEM